MITLTIEPNYSTLHGLNEWYIEELRHELRYIKNPDTRFFTQKYGWDGYTYLMTKAGKFPTGLLDKVVKWLLDNKFWDKVTVVKNLPPIEDSYLNLKLNCVLRDYQQDAVNTAIERKRGIIHVATGGGKTEIAAGIIAKLGLPTLFLVPTQELLTQTKARLNQRLGVEIGTVTAGKFDAKDITVATYQTISSRLKEPACLDLLKHFKVGMFDEGHHIAAKHPKKCFMALANARYRFLLTATPYREDNAELELEGCAGPVIVKLGLTELVNRGYVCPVDINILEPTWEKRGSTKRAAFNVLYKEQIVENDQRNRLILDIVNLWHPDKQCIIFVKHVQHGLMLQRFIPNSVFLHGNNKDRKEDLEAFKSRTVRVLIGTSLVNEGVDIPTCEVGINASANKSKVVTYQTIGRICRKFANKSKALYYDIKDDMHPNFKKLFNTRKKVYEAEECFNVTVLEV